MDYKREWDVRAVQAIRDEWHDEKFAYRLRQRSLA